eukprot:gene5856-5766_t
MARTKGSCRMNRAFRGIWVPRLVVPLPTAEVGRPEPVARHPDGYHWVAAPAAAVPAAGTEQIHLIAVAGLDSAVPRPSAAATRMQVQAWWTVADFLSIRDIQMLGQAFENRIEPALQQSLQQAPVIDFLRDAATNVEVLSQPLLPAACDVSGPVNFLRQGAMPVRATQLCLQFLSLRQVSALEGVTAAPGPCPGGGPAPCHPEGQPCPFSPSCTDLAAQSPL